MAIISVAIPTVIAISVLAAVASRTACPGPSAEAATRDQLAYSATTLKEVAPDADREAVRRRRAVDTMR